MREASTRIGQLPGSLCLLFFVQIFSPFLLACDSDSGIPTAAVSPAVPPPPPEPPSDPEPTVPELPDISLPLRSVHMAGNWGTNELVIRDWEASQSGHLVPAEYMEWLESLHINWVGISVGLFWENYMDSTPERVYEDDVDGGTISDGALVTMVEEFKAHDISVYLTLALEPSEGRYRIGQPAVPDGIHRDAWPWRPDHPDHVRFATEFWDTYTQHAVHFARLAEDSGVSMYSLGTESDNIFRTRSDGEHNDFRNELLHLVQSVRSVYSGLLTYDMHYSAVMYDSIGSANLWHDLDLDIVGISAYFPLVDAPPDGPTALEPLDMAYEQVFQRYLLPLRRDNPSRPILFLEYGHVDSVRSPFESGADAFQPFVSSDTNGNGVDDGRETQANIYQALFNSMNKHPDLLGGAFFWDNWMTTDDLWRDSFAHLRTFAVRDKPAEQVIRSEYSLRQPE